MRTVSYGMKLYLVYLANHTRLLLVATGIIVLLPTFAKQHDLTIPVTALKPFLMLVGLTLFMKRVYDTYVVKNPDQDMTSEELAIFRLKMTLILSTIHHLHDRTPLKSNLRHASACFVKVSQ